MRRIIFACFLLASCNSVQQNYGAIAINVDGDATGLREIKVNTQMTIFGQTRGVFTAKVNALCVDRMTPNDVWPLILRMKDQNAPLPEGIPSTAVPTQNSGVNISINNENHK